MSDALTANDVRLMLEAACKASGSQSAWAKRHGQRPSTVNDVLRGRIDPTEEIAAALGMIRKNRYFPLRKVAA